MLRIRSFAFVLLASLPGFAAAADLNYDYLDLAYSRASIPFVDSPHGYVVDGSYDVAKSVFLMADYSHQSGNGVGTTNTVTYNDYLLGAGWHYGLSGSTDLVARLSYAHAGIKPSFGPTITSTGHDIGVGIRYAPLERLVLEAFLDHDTAGNVTQRVGSGCCGPVFQIYSPDMSGNILSGAVRYSFGDSFGVGLEYDHSSGYSEPFFVFHVTSHRWLLSGRWYY